MYLFFDTETTGIPRSHDAPASDVANWPRLVQIAWAITDEGGNELRSQAFIIRPDGFEIPASATRVQTLRTRRAFSRRNLGQTSSLKGTFCMSVMMRSSDRPMGK